MFSWFGSKYPSNYFFRSQKWRKALGIAGDQKYATVTPEKYNNRIKICSLHFTNDSFTCKFGNQLTPTAIPSLKLSTQTGNFIFDL